MLSLPRTQSDNNVPFARAVRAAREIRLWARASPSFDEGTAAAWTLSVEGDVVVASAHLKRQQRALRESRPWPARDSPVGSREPFVR